MRELQKAAQTAQTTDSPDRIDFYFRKEWRVLALITVSGLIYNLGLLAGPWFEGRMTGCLIQILNGSSTAAQMLTLVCAYILSIAVVQGSRYIKRFYVRRFANNVNRRMKQIIYASLVRKSRNELQEEGAGTVMTKAILDVDDCVEGMRKFTTEVFDTGVALLAYAGMLLYYDWRLALLSIIFPPVSYFIAEKMKVQIQKAGAAYKEQAGALSTATLDRAVNALTYRVFGCEQERGQDYEQHLSAYEKAAVKANVCNTVMQPLYRVISMTSVLFIFYFGGKNVLGNGWRPWNVAVFTTFLSCFTKLAVKSSSAAKLFNAVHKAQVSWKRIQPFMKQNEKTYEKTEGTPGNLQVTDLGFAYPGGTKIFEHLDFSAKPGQILGITGPVACGKSTLGKTFLCEYPYEGSIRFAGQELSGLEEEKRVGMIGYLGHDPELFHDTIKNNISLGDEKDTRPYLNAVCLDEDLKTMEAGAETVIGNDGMRLSGGQAQRLALARTLYHKKLLLILDDPFSALDRNTEKEAFAHLRELTADSIVLLISHRLYLFSQMDRIIWMEGGKTFVGSHEELLKEVPEYARLYAAQEGGAEHDET